MKKLTLTLAMTFAALLLVSNNAFACDGDCPCAKGEKAKWMLTELEGEGFLVNAVVKAEGEERTKVTATLKSYVESCTAGECKCEKVNHCPFAIKGLTYEVKEVETGLEVKVTGGCPGKRGAFKRLMEAMISGKPVAPGTGGCPHAKPNGDCTKAKQPCNCKGGCDK